MGAPDGASVRLGTVARGRSLPMLSRFPRGPRLVMFATGLSWLGLLRAPQADGLADCRYP
jgi:hypothetical protein